MTTKQQRLELPLAEAVARLRARVAGSDAESGFALIFALGLIAVLTAVSLAMAGMILSQTQPTQVARKNVNTVNAAGAGLQATLAQLRAANDGAGNGVLQNLPCTSATGATLTVDGQTQTMSGYTFNGSVNESGGDLTYTTAVAYFLQDPSGKSAQWMHDNALPCPLGSVPTHAFLQSAGQGGAVGGLNASVGNRTQHGVYEFATINTNTIGGRIIGFGSDPAMCLDVAPSEAHAGGVMTVQPCLALGTARQTWQYRTDLTIYYGGDPSLNLCIEKPTSGTTPTLQTCTTAAQTVNASTYPYASGGQQQRQEWGFNDSGHFAAALDNGTVTNGSGGTCLQAAGHTYNTQISAGAALITTACDGQTTGYTAWDPDPQVGAGKAGGNETGLPGAPTQQYVNYKEFGRCLDVTGQNVNADHLIDYPCKQAPNSATLTWNQLWTWTASGTAGNGIFYTRYNSTNYCLTAPTSGTLITTTPCASTPGANQLWKPTGAIPGNYTGSYNLISASTGKCMSASRTGAITFGSSNIILETCDGSLAQKWNAPPNQPNTGLGNLQEDAGGGG